MKIYRNLLATVCLVGFLFFAAQVYILSSLLGFGMYLQVAFEHAAFYFAPIYLAATVGLYWKKFFGVVAYCLLVVMHLSVNAFFFERIHSADLFAMFHSMALLIYAVLLLKQRKAAGITRI